MFFNAVWIYGAAALLVLGMATRQPALTVLATLVLLTAGVSWPWSGSSLHAVSYRRRLSATRVFGDESVTLGLELVNQKLLPLAWIEVEDELPDRIEPIDRRATASGDPTKQLLPYLTSLRPYERVAWTVTLRCPHRGAFAIGPTRLHSGDIFGFFRRDERTGRQDTLIVYPHVVPLPDLGIPPRSAFGDTRVPRALLVDPLKPVGVRDYRPDDSFRHVHWKATARVQELQVRVFEPTTVTQLGIFINLDSSGQYWRGLDTPQMEAVISAAASLATHAVEERHALGVYSNRLLAGSNRALRVPPGKGPEQLGRVLESLAKLSPFAIVDFPGHLRVETRSFPWGSTIVIVTAVMTPELAATLESLRAAGHRLVLVAIRPVVPPPIRGLIVHRLPDALLADEYRRVVSETETEEAPAAK